MEDNIDLDRGAPIRDGGGGGKASDDDEPNRGLISEAQTQLIIDDITAACNSLGKLDENDGTYMKDRDCKPCLKEIIRLLNADTSQHVARKTLGSLNIIKSDLIPLMNQYCDFNDGDTDLFNLIVRICTSLTSSVLLLFRDQEMPTDPEMIKVYNKLVSGLSNYKRAFADDGPIWKMLNAHLWHTEEEVAFERLLILIRNVLHIPVDSSADLGMHNEFDTHALCLYRMEQGGLFNTIIKIASETQRGSEFCFHIIEIVHLMLRDQNPATVARCKENNNKRKLDDDDGDRKRLAELAAREKRDRVVTNARLAPPRFKNSLFVLKNCQALGQNHMLSRRIVEKNDDLSFDAGKTQLRKAKNRKPLSSETSSAVLSDRNTKPTQVTYKLKIFSMHFVQKVYSNYMQQIKHNLIQKKAVENDESYYLWAIQYFTAFNRYLCLSLDDVSETMSTSTLHFIQILITSYQDKIKIEKNRTLIERTSKRLHLALRAYKEILNLIESIKPGSEFWNTIEKIKKNILTELDYNSLLLTLFQQYEESKHCPEYLKDLIATNDTFLDLLEDYTKTHGPIDMVTDEEDSDIEENLLTEVNGEPSGTAEQEKLDAENPTASKTPMDQSLDELLNSPTHEDQPTTSPFDSQPPQNTQQMDEAERRLNDELFGPTQEVSTPVMGGDKPAEMSTEDNRGVDMEIPASGKKRVSKLKKKKKKRKKKGQGKDLRAVHFMSRYCSPEVVKAYLEVLRDFKRNDSELNLKILKFFKRVVYDCRCEVMLMQASVFSCFLEIIDYDPSMPGHEEFVDLSKHLMEIFGVMITKKRWMIQELLFWKSHNDIVEIEMAVDPPRQATPVAPSPTFVDEELPLNSQNIGPAEDEQLAPRAPTIDALDELMAELGSDSSPEVSDADDDFGDDDGDNSDDQHSLAGKSDVPPSQRQQTASSARMRLLSSSEDESNGASGAGTSRPTVRSTRPGDDDIYPSDSDDLSSPPSPIPSPSPEPHEILSDLPVANEDLE